MTSRDGASQSLWQTTVNSYIPSSAALEQDYDVAIAGGGITGITLAFLLQEAGKKCVVLESHSLGYGTTGGTTAHLNTLLDTPYHTIIKDFGLDVARNIAQATRDAVNLFKEHVGRFNIDCGFEPCDGYLFAQNDEQLQQLRDILDGCRKVGLEVSPVNELDIPVPTIKTIKVADQAKIHPLRYVFALAKEFENRGGVIVENCRVMGTESKDDLITVETTRMEFRAGAVVFATHIPIGINILHLRCPAYRSYAMAVKLEDGAYPRGVYYDLYDPYHYYRTQQINGDQFLIVGGEDHKTGEEPNTNGCFLQLEAHIRSHFKVKEIVQKWSSQFFEPVDGIPYIGHLPGNHKNAYVATGYGGNGITYSHIAAPLLRDIILGRTNPLAEIFTPGRLKPVAGFADFVRHNTDVVKQFVSKRLGQEEMQELSALSIGEARVVKFNDEPVALYKDDEGNVHAISPTCTHMKCSVSWNAAERSWDCPCHGARYSCDGEVLTGPAVRGLEPVALEMLIKES